MELRSSGFHNATAIPRRFTYDGEDVSPQLQWANAPAGTNSGPVKRGVGVDQSFWPGIVQTNAACEVRLHRDGSVELRHG